MDEAFMGMIQSFAFNYAPYGWALCNGQIIAIMSNTALYSLLGTTFGGDGKTTFGLPDLQCRTLVGVGWTTGPTSTVEWGEKGGVQSVNLLLNNLPMHNHALVNGNGTNGTSKVTTVVSTVNNEYESAESNNGANALGTSGNMPSVYRESPSGADHIGGVISKISGSTSVVGSSATTVDVRNPFLGLYYCISTYGYYPSRP
jgi:microcystin-dependent protein